jgi:hypothetical protein
MSLAANLRQIVRTVSLATANAVLLIGADAAQAQADAKPRPEGFGPATPVPSSFLLVIAGLAVLLGWRWWRSRARAQGTYK